MRKTKQKSKMQKRDLAILLLILAVIGTNWVWYQHHQAQELSLKNDVQSWLQHQVQINKLKGCIDQNVTPCDISTQDELNFNN